MSLTVIDERGKIWNSACIQLRQSFGSTYSDLQFSEYVVRNLGFIAINQYSASCQIRVRPAIVNHDTVKRLTSYLDELQPKRVALNFFDDDWQLELHRSSRAAIQKLIELMVDHRTERPQDFIATPMDFSQLPKESPLVTLLELWPHLSENLHQDGLRNIVNQVLNGRYAIASQNISNDGFHFEEMGPGFLSYDNLWVDNARGAPVHEQPDKSYGKWIEGAYHTIARHMQPRADNVDVIIEVPSIGRARRRYRRIILPFKSTAGSTSLLCGSVIDDRIDLRAKAV